MWIDLEELRLQMSFFRGLHAYLKSLLARSDRLNSSDAAGRLFLPSVKILGT